MPTTTPNQQVLAKIHALEALRRATQIDRRTPREHLFDCLSEAIRNARADSALIEQGGMAGSEEHLLLRSRIARWEAAIQMNR